MNQICGVYIVLLDWVRVDYFDPYPQFIVVLYVYLKTDHPTLNDLSKVVRLTLPDLMGGPRQRPTGSSDPIEVISSA